MLTYILCLVAVCHAWPSYGGLRDPGNCNPLIKDSHCNPDSAFASRKSFNFETASYNQDFENFWTVDEQTQHDRNRLGFNRESKSLEISMSDQNQAPTLTSHQYLLFGKVTVKVKASKGPGLVTTVVLKSDSGDEIDWEMLGAFKNQAQSNYYYNGQPLFNTYNTTYSLASSSFDEFHTYTVEWTDEILRFSIDGAERRTWRSGEIPSDRWPQTPMQVKLGLWAVESFDDPGEIAWAGGVADWRRGPFTAAFQSVEIEDYTGWCEEVDTGSVEYQYDGDAKGWPDVRVAGCQKRRAPGVTAPTPDGTSDSPSSSTALANSTGGAKPTDHDDNDNGKIENENGSSSSMILPSVSLVALMGLGLLLVF